MKKLLKRLTSEFEDGEYAHAYMESFAISRIAAQVYTLRKQRGWTQSQLSAKSGVAQERISKIESGDFTSLTMSTLHKFARAFDIDLTIRFRAFSEAILDVVNLGEDKLKVEGRAADLGAFCLMEVNERKDGSINTYSIPAGMSSIIVTGEAQTAGNTIKPTVGWQQLSEEVPTMLRAGTC